MFYDMFHNLQTMRELRTCMIHAYIMIICIIHVLHFLLYCISIYIYYILQLTFITFSIWLWIFGFYMYNINTTHVKTQTNYFYIFGFYLRICHGHQEVVLGLQSCEAPQGLKIWDVEGKKSSNRFHKTIIGGGCWRLHRLAVRFFLNLGQTKKDVFAEKK